MHKTLGVGINYHSEVAKPLVDNLDRFDFVEINTERLFQPNLPPELQYILANIPVVLHGLTLSLGTLDQEISPDYLKDLRRTLDQYPCEWFSEHLAITSVDNVDIRGLMPAAFTLETVRQVVSKVKQIMSLTNRPFLLENITYYYPMPNNTLSEINFINEIVDQTGCNLLLDLNNLYVNAHNHGYNTYDFIDHLPLDKIVEVHLAGCDYIHGMLVDTHASSVKNEVIDLFHYLCEKTPVFGVIIERDDRIGHFEDLVREVEFVRSILKGQNKHVAYID